MKVVLDTNIIFSAMLKNGKVVRDLLFMGEHEYYSCNFSIVEIYKHKEKLLKYSKMEESELLEQLHKILKRVHFINEEIISSENFAAAFHLCKDIDRKDTVFIALALELGAVLWTGDKKLKDGLKEKGFSRFF